MASDRRTEHAIERDINNTEELGLAMTRNESERARTTRNGWQSNRTPSAGAGSGFRKKASATPFCRT
jgi:hypothetical protein